VANYIARETMNAMASGRFVRLVQGQPIELTDEEAAELMPLGVIQEIISAAPPLPTAPMAIEAEVTLAPPMAEVEIIPPVRRRRTIQSKA